LSEMIEEWLVEETEADIEPNTVFSCCQRKREYLKTLKSVSVNK